MKRSQLLAVTIVVLMMVSALPGQRAVAAGSYSEKLNVYVAGSDALWFFTFGGVNSSSRLTSMETTSGLSWYNLTAIKTTGWSSDFQLFGPRRYNLLPVPFIPSQGLFLTVGSDSFTDASAVASAMGSYLLTSFTSLSNSTGIYSFYSSVSFSDLVPVTLLKYLPSTEGGFAKAIASGTFVDLASPFIVLEGVKTMTGFVHNLVVGSIAAGALPNGQPALTSYFGGSTSSLAASVHSSSSVLQIRFLDGVVKSSDTATVVNNNARFTGSYTLSLSPGKKLTKVNATVAQQPAPLLASRAVDVGVLRTNGNVSVTLTLRNLSPSETITKLTFTDDWWNKTGVFKLVTSAGSDSVSSVSLSPGGTLTPVYRLRYTGTVAGPLTIPPSVVRYQYVVRGATFNATTVLNPIRLSLGADDAVVYATLSPSGGFGKAVGSTQQLNITVTNVGTLPASSVVVAGHPVAGLAARGGTATVTVSQTVAGLLGTNFTRAYSTAYQDPAGTALNASSNVISDVFSHTSMSTGFPVLTVQAQVASLANLHTNVTLTFSTVNAGRANVTSFKATDLIPAGLGCGTVSGKGLTCASGVLTISYPLVNESSSFKAYMKYNLTSPLNYLLEPFSFQAVSSGSNVIGRSNALAIPAGVLATKQFTPSQLFGGMGSTVSVTATNAGPLQAYNATVGSTADSFYSLASTAVLTKTVASIAAGGNSSVTYGVTFQKVSGVQTATVPTVSFYFGGIRFSVEGPAPKVDVYQPLGVSITTNPATPEEGKNFTISIKIANPAGVQVSDVRFTLPVPSGLGLSHLVNARVSSGVLEVTASTLGPHDNITSSAVAVASSGITVPFQNAKLTFAYSGVTIAGTIPKSSGIGITEDVTTRYIIPTAFIILAVFGVAFYVRKKAASVPASQK